MIRQLVMLRHAEALTAEREQRDFERALSRHGRHQSEDVAKALSELALSVQSVLASAATRTLETAHIVAKACAVPRDRQQVERGIYDATAGALLTRLQQLDVTETSVLLVAHNPGVSVLAQSLVPTQLQGFSTAGYAVIHFACPWRELAPGCGVLVAQA